MRMFCLLKVIDGPARGSQLLLGQDQRLLIGRISTADFPIASDNHLSRKHLIIQGETESFRVTDAGSSNGTYVNNTPITSALLCTGDIIRAGKSLFEVHLKRETEAVSPGETSSDSLFESLTGVPNRSISAEIPDDDQTALFRLSDPTFGGETKGNSANGDETTLCAPVEDMEVLQLIASHFAFEDPADVLWAQRSQCLQDNQLGILRSFEKLPLKVSLIINKRQMESPYLTLDNSQVTPGELSNLTETLCLVNTDRREVIQALCKACIGRDAMILVASKEQLGSKWIQRSIDAVSYPSLLSSIVQESTSRARSLTKGIEFLLFETAAGGPLGLLPSSDLWDKIHLFKFTGS